MRLSILVTLGVRLALVVAVVAPGLAGLPAAAEVGSSHGRPWLEFSFAEVGDLGGTASFARDIAPTGTVVGTATTTAAPRPQLAFVDDGTARSLGTLAGSTFSRAMGVNARGDVVGEAFTPDETGSRAVAWDRHGRLRVLAGLRGADSSAVAHAVNARGDVVGSSTGPDGRVTAVIWPRGRDPRALPWLVDMPGALARAWDVSDTGTVVGAASVADDEGHSHRHAVRWDRHGPPTDLGVLDEHGFSVAYAVLDGRHSLVVGEASQGANTRAVIFGRSGPIELPTPDGLPHARANDIARNGWIVGHAARFQGAPSFGGVAALWVNGRVHRLADLTVDLPAGWQLLSAEAIDDHGRIVGYGTVDGQIRALLLTPRR